MELSRKVVTKVWFEVFALMVLAFLPFLLAFLFAQIAQVKVSMASISILEEIFKSNQPDLKRLTEVIMQSVYAGLPYRLLAQFIFLLNLPFAVGALMHAYENLFGTRTASRF